MPTKLQIIDEIKRTAAANNSEPLGWRRFETATGIRYADWFGIHWARWNDAVKEAGLEPNELKSAYQDDELLEPLAVLTQELRRLPTVGDLRMARRSDPTFPSDTTFGNKSDWISRLAAFCESRSEFALVKELCDAYGAQKTRSEPNAETSQGLVVGSVYLLKHGSRREYKIGRTYNQLRREGEIGIELPEKVKPIHVIETDDPPGVEAYWHRRFADKRLSGEWFALSAEDVKAFKRWRRIV